MSEALKKRPSRDAGQTILTVLILVISIYAVYGGVSSHQFLSFDDNVYVTENPRVRSGLTLSGLKWAFTTTHYSYWHPLTWVSHMLDVHWFGIDPGAHHTVNLVWHLINSLFLFFVLRRMTGCLWRSGCVAALFAVHPLNVESVIWISERKNLVNTFFWLATLWAYTRYVERPGHPGFGWVVLFYILGLMTKPMIVTLPFALLLLDLWPLGRFTPFGSADGKHRFLSLIKEKRLLFLLSLVSGGVTFWGQKSIGAMGSFETYPLGVRMGNALMAYAAYLRNLVVPYPLSGFYPHPLGNLNPWQVAAAAGLLLAVSVLAFSRIKSMPFFATGWLWYLGTLVPVIGLVQVGPQAMADRYTYVPAIGIFILFAWGLFHGREKTSDIRVIKTAAMGLILMVFMVLSRYQVDHWKDDQTFFSHLLSVNADNYLAHNGMGLVRAAEGRIADAVAHYREAIRIKPDYSRAHNNLGNALLSAGKLDEAVECYRKAVFHNDSNAKAHNNLAVALLARGDAAAAIRHFQAAISIYPDYISARLNLAQLHMDRGDDALAAGQLDIVLRLAPGHATANKLHKQIQTRKAGG